MTPRRPHARLPLPATLGVATLLALTGCGADDAGAVSQGELPTSPATSSAAAPTATATQSPSPSESASEPSETAPPEGETTTPAPTPTSNTTSGTTSGTTSEPRLIVYAGGESPGVEVHDRSDTEDLRGAPTGFKEFIGRTAERIADESTCEDGYVGVTVQKLRTDGYATGGVNDCGGYRAMWAVVDGSWTEVAGTQEMWDCAVLERYDVPSDVAGPHCYDYDAQKERPYEAS